MTAGVDCVGNEMASKEIGAAERSLVMTEARPRVHLLLGLVVDRVGSPAVMGSHMREWVMFVPTLS